MTSFSFRRSGARVKGSDAQRLHALCEIEAAVDERVVGEHRDAVADDRIDHRPAQSRASRSGCPSTPRATRAVSGSNGESRSNRNVRSAATASKTSATTPSRTSARSRGCTRDFVISDSSLSSRAACAVVVPESRRRGGRGWSHGAHDGLRQVDVLSIVDKLGVGGSGQRREGETDAASVIVSSGPSGVGSAMRVPLMRVP